MPIDSGSPPWPPQPPTTQVETAEPPSKKRPGWFGWVVGLVVLVVAAGAFFITKSIASGGGSSPASASTSNSGNGASGQNGNSQSRFPGTAGQITAINGTTLTLQDRQNQSVNVTTTSSTRITVQRTVSVSDITEGDRITVSGTESGTTIAATRITIADLQRNGTTGGLPGGRGGPPATDANGNPTGNGDGNGNRRPPGGFAAGTVTNVNGNTITLSSFNGSTITVTTTSSTTVTKSVAGTFNDLKVGQTVRVVGNTGSDGTVAATSINEGAGGFGFGGGRRALGTGTP